MGLFDSFNQFAGGLSPQAGLGLLASGTSLLSGAPVGQAINTGFGTYQNFLDMDKEKKRREALKQYLADPKLTPEMRQLAQVAPNAFFGAKATALAGGRSAGERERNKLIALGLRLKRGEKLTPAELAEYSYLYQEAQKTKTQTYTDPATNQTVTAKMPGINLSFLPIPPVDASSASSMTPTAPTSNELSRETKVYPDAVKKDAKFAKAMLDAQNIMFELEAQGYNPAKDFSGKFFEVVNPEVLGSLGLSEQAERYIYAKQRFIEASLRRDSGAAINQDEYKKKDRNFFGQVGNDPATLKDKALARKAELKSFYSGGKDFFNETFGKEEMDRGLDLDWDSVYNPNSQNDAPTETFINIISKSTEPFGNGKTGKDLTLDEITELWNSMDDETKDMYR